MKRIGKKCESDQNNNRIKGIMECVKDSAKMYK